MGRRLALALVAVVVASSAACGEDTERPSIAVGATADPESTLIAHLYAAALRSYGNPAHVKIEDDPLTGLDTGAVRVVPGLTGRLLHRFNPEAAARAPTQVYREMVSALPEGVAAGDYTTSAEDKPALAVTEATAGKWDGRDVTAAVRNCDGLTIAAVADAPRPEAIGMCEPNVTEFPDSDAAFDAVRSGRFPAAWTTTAAPGIPPELVMLSDRTSLIRAENLVPLSRRNGLNESQVLALNEVAGVLDTAALAEMRAEVADGADPGHVAEAFLSEHPLGDS
ncbi:glycine betaine/choline ABC transporter substrate-binding protein [Mycolicibacterium flavescens]|uniref:glycine betaine ABC transporter substrate-binding protein n=1 Tax=Mycobacterium neumannii TaxID=2048551 RepID=UPI000F6BA7D2|nr:glycine betaine/choline ABC transporter substrate-binding protein [Mycolicibacterium flavescens]